MPDLFALLRDCYEPATRRNIVDAGLVRAAALTPDEDAPGRGIPGVMQRQLATITLYAPGSDETANAQLVAQIENRLLGVESISRVEVTLLPALFPILQDMRS
jgi:metal-sulfur cluster biosynthetic enzyme